MKRNLVKKINGTREFLNKWFIDQFIILVEFMLAAVCIYFVIVAVDYNMHDMEITRLRHKITVLEKNYSEYMQSCNQVPLPEHKHKFPSGKVKIDKSGGIIFTERPQPCP